MKVKPNLDSQFFGAFHSGRVPKATKDVNVHFFIHNSNFCKLYLRIPVNYTSEFWELLGATACKFPNLVLHKCRFFQTSYFWFLLSVLQIPSIFHPLSLNLNARRKERQR